MISVCLFVWMDVTMLLTFPTHVGWLLTQFIKPVGWLF
jgi:hypothetical protein